MIEVLEPGCMIDGKYRILRVIGTGGMSVVYLAVNERANKHWAIKEVRRQGRADNLIGRQNLMVELDILRNIRHPGLPRIIDVIDTEDSMLIVMDYIHGSTLEEWVQHHGKPSCEQLLDWARQICHVLDYLHSREPPIIYGDLKPSNVMLTKAGRIILIDFGTARILDPVRGLSVSGPAGRKDDLPLGTRGYAAPEQYKGSGSQDVRTDIYCLGMTLFYLLTGSHPPDLSASSLPVRSLCPAIPEGLERIILRCTKEEPADRYQSCRDLIDGLTHYKRLESEYRKKQEDKLRLFLATCFITAFFGLSLLISGLYYHFLLNKEYMVSLDYAVQVQKLEDMERIVEYAVTLKPADAEAYLTLLSFMTEDCLFSDEEKTAMENLLYKKIYGRQNIERLRRNKDDYARFAYQLGLSCFFYYKGSRGKEIAGHWFEGLEDSYLEKDQRIRASIYARIGSYYSSLDHPVSSGEEKKTGDYRTFFQDLVSLNTFTPDRIGNSRAAVALYSEIARQIGDNADAFLSLRDGSDGQDITSADLYREINRMKGYMSDGVIQEADMEDIDKLGANLMDAEEKVEAAAGRYGRIISKNGDRASVLK